jgi:streptogramin lyase
MHLAVSHTKWAEQGRDAISLPYGIDINPVNGSICYAKLNVNKIGRINPKTFAVREFDTPQKGPRRLRNGRTSSKDETCLASKTW